MSLNPFGLDPSQLERLVNGLETQGGLSPVDPGAQTLGRGTSTPFIFSNVARVPGRALATDPVTPTPLLTVQGRDGICRRWSVQVLARPVDLGPTTAIAVAFSTDDALRVRLTMGSGTVSFDCDVPGGSAAFECYAQSIDLAYLSADVKPPDGPKPVLAVVSPVLGGQSSFPGMFPTRTVLYDLPAVIGNPVVLPIPKFAQAVMVSAPPAALAFTCEWRNTYGAAIAGAQSSTWWQQVPNGAGQLAFVANPTGAAAVVAVIYRLGV